MSSRIFPLRLSCVLAVSAVLFAQPVVQPPNYHVSTLAVGIPITGALSTMATDFLGNVYLVDDPFPPSLMGPRVHRIRRDGTVDLDHALGFGDTGQLAHDPTNGLVYLVDHAPFLPVINSKIWRIEPGGGKTFVRNVPVVAEGFTIGNDGSLFLGGTGIQGPGLYRIGPNTVGAQFLGPGFGSNSILQSLVSGDVLIAHGNRVERWTPGAAGTVLYWQGPLVLPNALAAVNSLARTPFNQIGSGAVIGVRNLDTFCFCGTGKAVTADLVGQNPATFATEPFGGGSIGLQAAATGIRQDLYWADVLQGIVPGFFAAIYKVRQLPAHGSAGSLLVDVQGGVLTFDLYGDPAGGSEFLLGAMPLSPISFSDGLFIPPFGILDLNPLVAGYIPILDGLGIFGPPNPFAVIPVGGHFSLTISVPPVPQPISLRTQAGIVDAVHAPNGLFYITNVDTFVLQ